MNRQAILYRRGIEPIGNDSKATFDTPAYSSLQFGVNAEAFSPTILGGFTNFDLLPAASVAAGTDALGVVSGTGTEVIARSASGGVNLKTQATTPADGDNVIYAGVTTTAFQQIINANAGFLYRARVAIGTTAFATMFASFGPTENVTDVDPTGTAGDGAVFLFDPTGEVVTGLPAGSLLNWILCYKVNGTDTFADSGVPVVADLGYDLAAVSQLDLTAKMYINGELVGTSPALTTGDSLRVFHGAELTATPAGQADFDTRFISLTRSVL